MLSIRSVEERLDQVAYNDQGSEGYVSDSITVSDTLSIALLC
jgi:hypothetical protein